MSGGRWGLVGRVLGHSFSPQLHRLLWGCDYRLFPMEEAAAKAFFARRDFDGVNVTIPYKQLALAACDIVDDKARAIGAVNTVVNRNGVLYGFNTDLAGMTQCLARAGIRLAGKKVLVFGSGGTSHTACAAADALGAREIVVVSRRGENNYDNLDRQADAEILLNTTPLGMYPDLSGMCADPARFPLLCGVMDAVYNPLSSRLVQRARACKVPATGGLPMLVGQAVAAAELFSDQTLPSQKAEKVLATLKREESNLVLIGMPGCGKSTVGAALADALGREFVDLDAAVEAAAGKAIPRIFAEDGEEAFRRLETQAALEAGRRHGLVVACGGGCVLREENRFALRANGRIYYLDRPLEKLATQGRPLSAGGPAVLQRLYGERHTLYEALCDRRIPVNGTAEEAVDTIREDFLL